MISRFRFLGALSAFIVLVLACTGSLLATQEEYRETIKLGIDSGVERVSKKPAETTLTNIREVERPVDFALDGDTLRYRDGRILGYENQLWEVTTTIRGVQIEADGTIKLLLRDSPLVEVEAASPDLIGTNKGTAEEKDDEISDRFKSLIEGVHKQLLNKLHPTLQPKEVNKRVRLIALGFFGSPILGNSCQNGAQLRPITSITFLK